MRRRLAAAVLAAGVLRPGGEGGPGRAAAAGWEAARGPGRGQEAASGPRDEQVAACGPVDHERRVVRILAERFSFTPSEIRVARGTTLELRIRSDDTMHGFRIVGRNVNLLVPKRRQGEAVVVFEAVEVGRYDFECSRLCGAGHNFMRGAIVVEDHSPADRRGAAVEAPAGRASSGADGGGSR